MKPSSHFSLWLVPEAGVAKELRAWIEDLAVHCKGPVFPPHLTLLSHFQSQERGLAAARALEAVRGAVPVIATAVDGEDSFFRNLYLRVDPRSSILPLHLRAGAAVARPIDSGFLPHVSLFYGSLGPALRERSTADIRRRLPMEMELDAAELWSVEGPVETWRRLFRTDLRA